MNFQKLVLASIIAASATAATAADVNLQRLYGPNGEAVTSSTNFLSMSKNGRYILLRNDFDQTLIAPERIWVKDIKTSSIKAVSAQAHTILDSGYYGISENGQYAAYIQIDSSVSPSKYVLWVTDLVTDTQYKVQDALTALHRPYVANNGDVIFNAGNEIKKYNFQGATQTLVTGQNLVLAGTSANAENIVFVQEWENTSGFTINGAFLYNVESGTSQVVSEDLAAGRSNNVDVKGLAISSNSKFVAVTYPVYAPGMPLLEVINLETGAVIEYEESDLHIEGAADMTTYSSLSVSNDGRYVAMRGNMQADHPDYDVAASSGRFVFDRIFRIDTTTAESLNVSPTYDGSANDNFVNIGAYISNDGRHVGFAANAKNLLPSTPISAEEPYHAYATTYAANYMFVGMPNSDQGWKHYSNMSLVADNTWEGVLTFDGVGTDAFKFDVGGSFSGFDYVAAGNWSENYGKNGVAFGDNIVVTEGAGDYLVTFNDITKQSTVTKIVEPSTGTDVDVTFTCQNGTTYSGQSIYVVGNIAELGNWDKSQAVKLDPTSYPTWSGTITLPADTAVEWKCIKREENNPNNGVQWQGGSNNTVNTASATSTTGSF